MNDWTMDTILGTWGCGFSKFVKFIEKQIKMRLYIRPWKTQREPRGCMKLIITVGSWEEVLESVEGWWGEGGDKYRDK